MAVPLERLRHFSIREYFELERQAQFRSEYYCGQIVAMAGGNERHSAIKVSITTDLDVALRSSPCNVFDSDMRMETPDEPRVCYPDASVVCGKPVFSEDDKDTITNPRVLIEVLSKSTTTWDRKHKLEAYRQIESLTDYVIVFQDQPKVEHWHRSEGTKDWSQSIIVGLDASIGFVGIDCTLSLADIYRRVDFTEND
jgi:Uma2 family endonuclease